MGMKYKDPSTGQLKELSLKAADTLPIGTIVDYDGKEVPEGWEKYGTDDYSTEETFTGKHWIDGKSIYRKVIDIGNLPNATKKEVTAGISNLKYVTRLYGLATTGAYTITIPDTYPNNAVYDTRLSYDNSTGKIVLFSESDRSTYTGYVIMEYTKTTD